MSEPMSVEKRAVRLANVYLRARVAAAFELRVSAPDFEERSHDIAMLLASHELADSMLREARELVHESLVDDQGEPDASG